MPYNEELDLDLIDIDRNQARNRAENRTGNRSRSGVSNRKRRPVQGGPKGRPTKGRPVRRRRKKRKSTGIRVLIILWICILLVSVIGIVVYVIHSFRKNMETGNVILEEYINEEGYVMLGENQVYRNYITVSEYSRPGKKMKKVNGVVIHYTGNPGSTAEGNRNYFENLKSERSAFASSHFVVGLEGEIIQCVPLNEQAITTKGRNEDTIGIEVCHPDADGKFNDAAYESLIRLVAWICDEYNLKEDQILRHYDVTEKICPKYYVENEDAWVQMKSDILNYRKK